MTFPSVEEKDSIGKRRKLSQNDESRIALGDRRHCTPPFRSQQLGRNKDFCQFVPDDIAIHIGGPKTCPLRAESRPEMWNGRRSESMLLDIEETCTKDPSLEVMSSVEIMRRSTVETWSDDIEIDDSKTVPGQLHTNTLRQCLPDEVQADHTQYTTIEGSPTAEASLQDEIEVDISRGSLVPPFCHRFTLDDQILAERRERRRSECYDDSQSGTECNTTYVPSEPQGEYSDSWPSNRTNPDLLPGAKRSRDNVGQHSGMT